MGRLVYTVTSAGATAGLMTTAAATGSNPNSGSVQGQLPFNYPGSGPGTGYQQNYIVSDTHPMVQQWLAAGWIAQITL